LSGSPFQNAPGFAGGSVTPNATSELDLQAPSMELYDTVMRWSGGGRYCGLDPEGSPPAVDAMAGVDPMQAGRALFYILMTERLGVAQMRRLIELLALASTEDARRSERMAGVYDAAGQIVARLMKEQLESDPDQKGIRAFRDDVVNSLRSTVIRHTVPVVDSSIIELILRALDAPDPLLRQAAVIALAQRSDYPHRERLYAVRGELHPGLHPAIDAVLR
jgi:hypothetical protein